MAQTAVQLKSSSTATTNWRVWLGVAPFLLFAVLFLFLPSLRLFTASFTDSDGITHTAVSLSVIPQSAKIGDFGTVGTYSGAGETTQIAWQLKNANNGLANQVISETTTIFGNLEFSEETSYVIDESGNRKSVTAKIYYADSGITVTLSGNEQ